MIHKHLLITALIKDAPQDEAWACQWLLDLVDKIGMEVFMPPICKFDTTEGNIGLTGIIGLTTSHISFHAWNKSDKVKQPFINMDVYSCKDFNSDVVLKHMEVFGIIDWKWQVIDRSPS
jgi:S-adenosylmethionine/arginine decarboxylase-like enzyme